MSLGNLARIQCYLADKAIKDFWTSFGDNEFGREEQSIQANNQASGKDAPGGFGAWCLKRVSVQQGSVTSPHPHRPESCAFSMQYYRRYIGTQTAVFTRRFGL